MLKARTIKVDIIETIKQKFSNHKKLSKIISKVKEELDILDSTEGLESENNLNAFYNIWDNNRNKIGDKNEINSWTAYFLGMTKTKPTGDFLPNRRAFARTGMPDIDTDFDYEDRDKVYSYIIEKYGRENVGNIGTHGLLKFKSCVTRVAKALDLANSFHKGKDDFVSENFAKVTEILSPFPKKGLLKVNDEEGNSHLIKTFEDGYRYCSDFRHYVDKYKNENFGKHIEKMEGIFANFGCLSKDTPILTNRGWIRIDQLSTKIKIAYIDVNGDIRYTNNFKFFKTGIKKTCRLRLSNHAFIDVTDEHLIFTDKGCIKFKKIRQAPGKYKIYSLKGEFELINTIKKYDIISIEELNKKEVYDISIINDSLNFFQNEHNYIANKIMVHNSHAAGIVVSNVPLNEVAPLRNARKGMLATQFPNEDLEELGLIKFDILAISTLSVIKKTIDMVQDHWGIEIDIKKVPLDDDEALSLYRNGNLGGVFQCENYGMQKTMKKIGVDRFEDIVAGLSLYRPGPMDSIPEYCARKKGEKEIDYFHSSIEPFVKPYLKNTYGILAYQEQVMQICNSLANFTITDGYIMIKAIGKKKENLMNRFEKQFINGCINNKVPKDVAKQYWDKFIKPFSSYGFNKSHAACYGYNSYLTAYLKANYPDEFICSLLEVTINSSTGDRYDKIKSFEKEFKRKMGIKFLKRDINKCKASYTIEKRKDKKMRIKKTEIRPSLLCKGLSLAAAQNIEENQPFKDMKAIVEKTDSSVVDTRAIDALITGGYFGNKAKKKKDSLIKDFVMIREDMKKVAKKKMESVDMFGQ